MYLTTPISNFFSKARPYLDPKEYAALLKRYLVTRNKSHMAFIGLVLAIDIALVICFLLFAWAGRTEDTDSFFYANLNFSFADGNYLERFGYCLEVFTAAVFLVLAFAHKQWHWLAWSAIYAFVFIDDSYRIHENIGYILMGYFGTPNFIAEFLGFATLGIVVFLLWLIGLAFKPKHGQQLQTYFLYSIYLGLLIFFAVFVDAIHSFVEHYLKIPVSRTLWDLGEDGSELTLLSLSAITAVGFWCTEKDKLGWKK